MRIFGLFGSISIWKENLVLWPSEKSPLPILSGPLALLENSGGELLALPRCCVEGKKNKSPLARHMSELDRHRRYMWLWSC
jgi:hypothetical protein